MLEFTAETAESAEMGLDGVFHDNNLCDLSVRSLRALR